jgi:hypothetical protein
MVKFVSTLQKSPPVFSDAISVACTAHSWEMFCCSFGRILRGNVSTDMCYPSFYFVSHFIILLSAHLLARYSFQSVYKFTSFISLVTSSQIPYHT